MENASRALLIIGGVLLAIILLGAVWLNYNKMVDFYNKDKDITKAEQIAKFNGEYTQFERNNVRGSDLLSLVNKVVDNNERNEEKIDIEIIINDLKEFTFDGGAGTYTKMEKEIMDDNKIITANAHILSSFVTKIEGSSGLSEKELQLLAKNISNLFVDASATDYQKAKRDDIIKDIYNLTSVSDPNIVAAQKAALEYYQIQQFKRARFDCTGIEYENGIVSKLTFVFNGNIN